MLEAEVEAYLGTKVRAAGGVLRKVRWIGRRGAPDRVIFGTKRGAVWVELKRPKGGKLSALQIVEHTIMRHHGEIVYILNSPQQVDEFMREVFGVETV